MAVSKREEAIAALHRTLQTIAGVGCWRSPNWPLGYNDLPAIVLEDGSEEVQALHAGVLHVVTTCTVEAVIKASAQELLGPTLNELAAKIRAAVGANPTLNDTCIRADYAGCKPPEFVLPDDGSPPHAALVLLFDLDRREAEHDPYAYL